jgi:hypothetical protein
MHVTMALIHPNHASRTTFIYNTASWPLIFLPKTLARAYIRLLPACFSPLVSDRRFLFLFGGWFGV